MTGREKTKAAPLSLHDKNSVNPMDLDHCLQTGNQMPMENLPMQNSNQPYQQIEFVIDAENENIQLIRNVLL